MSTYVIRDDKGLEEAYTKEEVDDLIDTKLDCENTAESFTYNGA